MTAFAFAVIVAAVCASAFAAGDDLECFACQYIVKEIEGQLAANKTQAQIIAHLNDACKHFGHLAGVCTSTVDKYAPALIAALANHEPPATACAKVGACKNSTMTEKAAPICAVCELVVGEVDKLVQQNKTESEIVTHLEGICKVTRHFKAECDKVVAEYVPEIISRLIAKEDPQVVCDHVHLCDNATLASRAALVFNAVLGKVDNRTCTICTDVLHFAEDYVKTHPNVTSQQVATEMDKFCHIMPANDSAKCTGIVTLFEPLIFTELKLGVPPAKICKDIHMCTATSKIVAEIKAAVESADGAKVVSEVKEAAAGTVQFLKKHFGRRRH